MTATIVIAGGGIGGLATALALAKHGIASHVLERMAEFSAAGAGIQIGPNGTRVLASLGLADAIEPLAGKPETLDIHDGRTGTRLTQLPLGETIARRHGSPYRTLHRADLQSVLLAAARRSPLVTITTGFPVERIEETATGVRALTDDGRAVIGLAAIAADGLRSRIRRGTFAAPALPSPTRTAARTLIPADRATPLASRPHVGLWMAPNAHVVHYPVRGGAEIAVVMVVGDDWEGNDWATLAPHAEIEAHARTLAPELARFLAFAPDWRKWSLYDVPPLPRWSLGRIALLGDAAHPMLPYFAQGGVMALEDAATIARCLAAAGPEMSKERVTAALTRYEAERLPRATAVQAASRGNGRLYHLTGLAAAARNTALRLAPPSRLITRTDWLYGWRNGGPT